MRWSVLAGGLMTAVLAAGCGEEKPFREPPKDVKAVKDVEHHHEHGPHGGHIVELGDEEYHAEVTFDAKDSKITVYMLDGTAKKAAPVDAKEVTLNLTIDGKPKSIAAPATPEAGEPAGKSSKFQVAGNADVKAHVKDEEDLKGRVSLTISGKPYSGDIEHHH